MPFNRECDLYLKICRNYRFSCFELGEHYNKAYLKTDTMQKDISGFGTASQPKNIYWSFFWNYSENQWYGLQIAEHEEIQQV